MSEKPIPVLATGRTSAIGGNIIDLLKPEYEVIHMTLASSIKDELPFLLRGKAPPSPSTTLGSGDWSSPPQALLIGGAYQDKDIDEIVKLVEGVDGAMEIPWLRVDVTKTEGPGPSANPTPEQAAAYGKIIVRRMKEGLNRLREEGKLGQGNGGIHLI